MRQTIYSVALKSLRSDQSSPLFLRQTLANTLLSIPQTMARRAVVIGLLGTTLDDRGVGTRRWEAWRPSVAACQHADLLVHRFELLHPNGATSLAQTVRDDIRSVSPETEVRLVPHAASDP